MNVKKVRFGVRIDFPELGSDLRSSADYCAGPGIALWRIGILSENSHRVRRDSKCPNRERGVHLFAEIFAVNRPAGDPRHAQRRQPRRNRRGEISLICDRSAAALEVQTVKSVVAEGRERIVEPTVADSAIPDFRQMFDFELFLGKVRGSDNVARVAVNEQRECFGLLLMLQIN